jgi:hypothetical protein
MNFAIGTKKDYEKMLTKNEDKIMIGGIIWNLIKDYYSFEMEEISNESN